MSLPHLDNYQQYFMDLAGDNEEGNHSELKEHVIWEKLISICQIFPGEITWKKHYDFKEVYAVPDLSFNRYANLLQKRHLLAKSRLNI